MEDFINKSDVPSGRAISIRQPYVEQILRGTKKYEYRSMPTKIRGRVYLYASRTPGANDHWDKLKMEPGDLPSGTIVGSVEIVDCIKFGSREYGYRLRNPKRYKRHFKPRQHPQPCWFFPFGKTGLN